MFQKIINFIKQILPPSVKGKIQPLYHYSLALIGAIIYRTPAKKIKIVGVTGTKGKSTTAEFINSILENAGYNTALASTIRFKIGDKDQPNLFKMTMPGRFFLQKFLRKAVNKNCEWAILEMTSEGVKQYRHKFVYLDALVFTNLSPEHIESHGSFKNYLNAKLKLAKYLKNSPKSPRAIIANTDDPYGKLFLDVEVENKRPYSLNNLDHYECNEENCVFRFGGEEMKINSGGEFNLYNALAASAFADSINIKPHAIKLGLSRIKQMPGRLERINEGQNFEVVVDYAHTPDSLVKLYKTFPNKEKICVLGNTGGGRDAWKRPQMAKIAEKHCRDIILTNEDPYDEKPEKIIEDMKQGFEQKKPTVIMDRREAIKKALDIAKKNEIVLISGKGTDPYIMGPENSKEPWDDARVAKEELNKLIQ